MFAIAMLDVGWIVALAGARVGLAVGGLSCAAAAGIGLVAASRLRKQRRVAAAVAASARAGARPAIPDGAAEVGEIPSIAV